MEAVADTRVVSTEWRYLLLGALESSSAPRVCTTEDLTALVHRVRPRATPLTVRTATEGLVQARALTKVSRGLYLNRRCRPAAELSEAAQHIRQGALVSLESVLGECGFLNNPPAIVTALVPQRPDYVPNVGLLKTSGGQVFRFSALPERFFPGDESDKRLMLQDGRFCPTAKPEVAVLHWLRLAHSPRSSMLRPPQDVDFSVLDLELLKELAWRWDLSRALQTWMQEVEATGDIQEPSLPAARSQSSDAGAMSSRQRGEEAKQRLLARRRTTSA